MASQQNKQAISTSNEDAICNSTLKSSANFINKNCLHIEQLGGDEFHKSQTLNSSVIELDENFLPIQLKNDNEKCLHKGESRKRRFMELEIGEEEEEEKRRNLDLDLRLRPLGLQQKESSAHQSEISSTSSCMPLSYPFHHSSSSSSEESDESSNTIPEVDEAKSSLVLMGCSRCLIYVMVSQTCPQCPNCNTSILIDIFRNGFGKKSRKT